MRPRPGSRTGAVVSSTNSLVEPSSSARISRHTGLISAAAYPVQNAKVARSITMPCRARIWAWRYNGQWSAYLATTTWATSRSVGRPPSISRAGAAACTTAASQLRQAYFGRRVTITWYCAGTTSSRCERSSPITCIAPPQPGQAVSSGSMTTATRGRWSGNGPRAARRFLERSRRSTGSDFSCPASLSATACSRSSSARLSGQDPGSRTGPQQGGAHRARRARRRHQGDSRPVARAK